MTPATDQISKLARRLTLHTQRVCETLLSGGKKSGKEWFCGDVSGSPGDSMHVQLEGPKVGCWFDHATNQGGDLLKLVMENRAMTPIQAADWAREFMGEPKWQPNGHPTRPAWDPKTQAKFFCKKTQTALLPVAHWWYHDIKGAIIACVCRYEWSDPDSPAKLQKDCIPWRPTTEPGTDRFGKPIPVGTWLMRGWKKDDPEKPPVYNLHKLANATQVMIVEGEKKADLVPSLFPGWTGIAWQGGAKNASRIDVAPLQAFKGPLVLWPDNDKAGQDAMLFLKQQLPGSKIVVLPKEPAFPPTWDIADPVPEGASLAGILAATLNPPPPPPAAPKPYVALGTDERGYLFLSRVEGYVMHFAATELSELNIYKIAPDPYWMDLGMCGDHGPDWKAVAKYLIDECQAVGAFDIRRLRGRGVYIDSDRVVFHAGDCLYVDGVRTKTSDFRSEFLYPQRPPIRTFNLSDPLPASESCKLTELLRLCSWQNERDAVLLAGAIWLSFMPASLAWRAHVFIQAESGSGKSWILEHIEAPILGDFVRRYLGGSSTEAGIRQSMGIDCLAILLEEFDAEEQRARENLRNIYTLARQSSSNSGCIGVKGTQDGTAKQYHIRSNFFFHGTASGIIMKADRSRVAILELLNRSSGFDSTFSQIKSLARETSERPEWAARFAGRAISLVKPTLQSAVIFSDAVSTRLRDSRAADQFGALLAGAWMVENDQPPTPTEAQVAVDSIDWSDHSPDVSDTDHHSCLNFLLASIAEYEDGSWHRTPVGDLIRTSVSQTLPPEDTSAARQALIRWGIKVSPMGDTVTVANKHTQLARLFVNSPYAEKWQIHFRRLQGAVPTASVRFGTVISKAVQIPVGIILGPQV